MKEKQVTINGIVAKELSLLVMNRKRELIELMSNSTTEVEIKYFDEKFKALQDFEQGLK